MKKDKIKYKFAVKSKEELDILSHEELLEYVKNLTDNLVQKNHQRILLIQEYQLAKKLILPKEIKAQEKKVVRMVDNLVM